MVGKPPKGTGNYDKPSGDALEPVKSAAQRKGGKTGWVRLNASGNINRLVLEKSKIAALLRVPMRDLRVLEPSTSDSYSAAMLCRERAIVVNLEQIKVLITSEEVIMTDSQTATVTHFLPELQTRLLRRKRLQDEKDAAAALLLPITLSSVDLASMATSQSTGSIQTPAQTQQTPGQAALRGVTAASTPSASHSPSGSIDLSQPARASAEEVFPFEFVALEVALEMVCNSLEVEANKIELDGKPALEALRKQVNNVNLERVRRMKNRLVRITGRVSKVRDEIQRYLDDDSDMRDMYLTRKAKMQNSETMSQQETPPGRLRRDQRGGNGHPTTPGRSPLGVHGVHTSESPHFYDAYDDDKDLQELEDLLETYFTHIDSTFHSLNGLNEYIDDLEDLIEIELDSQRNQLIKLELILTTATLSLTCFSVVVGIFGMNITNDVEDKHGMFLLVVILGSFATLGLFLVLLRVCRYYKLF
jgi:magnesium transporter